ncbi:tetratricopeptide repeat protein [Kitasatospora sp. NPDC004289]
MEATWLAAVLAGDGTVVDRSAGGVRSGGVLTGLGGVGKTQLAADYARTAWSSGELDVLVWVTATSTAAVAAAFAQAGAELLGAEPEEAAQAFTAWLEPKAEERPCRWLVVLDDVADPADLRGWWPPQSPHGRTLVTTRRRDASLVGGGRRLVEVGLFTPEEAVSYLDDALTAHARHEPGHELGDLAADLGHLPLALSQAAAYLVDAGLTTSVYRALLADRTRPLASTVSGSLPDDQPHTLAAAWTLSIERADALAPAGLAAPMLRLAAFLDPNGIPESVLTSEPALTRLTAARNLITPRGRRRWWAGRRRNTPATVTVDEAVESLRVLHRLGLITHDPSAPHQTVRVHQLLQRAVRDTLDPDQYGRTARSAADALLATWPSLETGAPARTSRANADALTGHSLDLLHRPDAHPVLFKVGGSLGGSGQAAAACEHFRRLTATTAHHLGPEHSDTLAARQNFARWLGNAGDPAGAAAALEEVLADQVRVQGPDHPDTLTTRHDLALWRAEAGETAGAAAAFEGVLADQLQVLGPDHPDTLATRNNLALWRGQQGDAADAVVALEEILADSLRVRGLDHPSTLITWYNVAVWRRNAGDAAGATTALEEVLAYQVRLLGRDHPDTLTTRHDVALWLGDAGDATGAAAAFEELLADKSRVQGPDHPSTLAARHGLAFWRSEAGDPAGAAAALDEVIAYQVRVLGSDHPDTLTTRHSHAVWRGEAGDAAGAVAALEDLTADQLQVLGPDHPDTLTTRRSLAFWQEKAGGAAGAVEL